MSSRQKSSPDLPSQSQREGVCLNFDNCEVSQERISAFVASDPVVDDWLEEHLLVCGRCLDVAETLEREVVFIETAMKAFGKNGGTLPASVRVSAK